MELTQFLNKKTIVELSLSERLGIENFKITAENVDKNRNLIMKTPNIGMQFWKKLKSYLDYSLFQGEL